jgi:hypothetical protein
MNRLIRSLQHLTRARRFPGKTFLAFAQEHSQECLHRQMSLMVDSLIPFSNLLNPGPNALPLSLTRQYAVENRTQIFDGLPVSRIPNVKRS